MNFIIVDRSGAATLDSLSAPRTVAKAALPEVQIQPAAKLNTALPETDGTPSQPTADRRGSERPLERNRRWTRRERIDRTGYVSMDDSGARVACRVSDISQFGAMIELSPDHARQLSDTFVLVFYAGRIRSEVDCVLRWRKDGQVGLSFAGPVRSMVDRARG
jgi:hypothetical protein